MSITPEKRASLIKLGAITFAVLFAFWFILIRPAQAQVRGKNKESEELGKKIDSKKEVIHQNNKVSPRFNDSIRLLSRLEEQMVSGDNYLWIIKTLRDFESPQRLEFTKYDPPQIREPSAIAKHPYQVASYVVTGIAAYHDFGRFLARFENIYPHIRINRIDLEPASGGLDQDEKLSFLIELQVLVKPGATSKAAPRS